MNYRNATLLAGSLGALAPVVMLVSVLVLLAIDVQLIFYCLNDLDQRPIVTGGDKRFWTAAIILGGPMGQILYWLYGRGEY